VRAALVLCLAAAAAHADPQPLIADQELGARLGLDLRLAGVAPGGARIGGAWLLRMNEIIWFDGEASFTYGGGGPRCFLDRDRDRVCSPGVVSGAGFRLLAGARWFAPPRLPSRFVPYLRGGLGAEVLSYAADDVSGLALGGWAGAGGRYRVADTVAVGGDAMIWAGPTVGAQGIGGAGVLGLAVQIGVDLAL